MQAGRRNFVVFDACFPLWIILQLHSLTKTHFQRRVAVESFELSFDFRNGPAIVCIEKARNSPCANSTPLFRAGPIPALS